MSVSISPNMSWTEYLDKFYKPNQDLVSLIKRHDRENVSSLLCHEDMKIYGLYPLQEELILVTCNSCKKLIKIEALSHHYEINHKYAICNETAQIQFPITNHDRSSDEISLERQTKPETSETVIASDYKAKSLKELGLDRQGEVRMRDQKRKCRNSLNCKLHPISLRSNMKGRTKPYDNLFMGHKGQIQPERIANTTESTSLLIHQSDQLEATATKGYNEKELYTKTNNEHPFDHHYRRFHPIPAAVCAFGARSLIPGSYTFTRKCDKLCASLIFAINGSHK